jgi:hypothetical protein
LVVAHFFVYLIEFVARKAAPKEKTATPSDKRSAVLISRRAAITAPQKRAV